MKQFKPSNYWLKNEFVVTVKKCPYFQNIKMKMILSEIDYLSGYICIQKRLTEFDLVFDNSISAMAAANLIERKLHCETKIRRKK